VKRRALTAVVIAALLPLVACERQGVSVGAEELCPQDPALQEAAASYDQPFSPCAQLGENLLANASFEEPPASCGAPFCTPNDAEVPGWTTSAGDETMEIWRDGYLGVPAADQAQFIELDATTADTLSQELVLPGDQLVYWSFQHRGRVTTEAVEVLIGPPEQQESQGVFRAPRGVWRLHSGLYRVPSDATRIVLSLASLTGESQGNLVDDARVSLVE
jgi:hypothetical protein